MAGSRLADGPVVLPREQVHTELARVHGRWFADAAVGGAGRRHTSTDGSTGDLADGAIADVLRPESHSLVMMSRRPGLAPDVRNGIVTRGEFIPMLVGDDVVRIGEATSVWELVRSEMEISLADVRAAQEGADLEQDPRRGTTVAAYPGGVWAALAAIGGSDDLCSRDHFGREDLDVILADVDGADSYEVLSWLEEWDLLTAADGGFAVTEALRVLAPALSGRRVSLRVVRTFQEGSGWTRSALTARFVQLADAWYVLVPIDAVPGVYGLVYASPFFIGAFALGGYCVDGRRRDPTAGRPV